MNRFALGLAMLLILVSAGCTSAGPRKCVAGCSTCIFEMNDVTGCTLAVKIRGTPYLVTGSDIDDHGDAHAPDGLCNAARTAVVEGTIKDGKFAARKIEILP